VISFIEKLLVAAANLVDPSKYRRPTVRILAVYIVEALCDFVTRTPFEQQKFDYGTLLLFTVCEHFSVPAI
jgi:hypothetical protein